MLVQQVSQVTSLAAFHLRSGLPLLVSSIPRRGHGKITTVHKAFQFPAKCERQITRSAAPQQLPTEVENKVGSQSQVFCFLSFFRTGVVLWPHEHPKALVGIAPHGLARSQVGRPLEGARSSKQKLPPPLPPAVSSFTPALEVAPFWIASLLQLVMEWGREVASRDEEDSNATQILGAATQARWEAKVRREREEWRTPTDEECLAMEEYQVMRQAQEEEDEEQYEYHRPDRDRVELYPEGHDLQKGE